MTEKNSYRSFRQLIEAWPPGQLAADLGVDTQTVINWKGGKNRKQSIPSSWWNSVVAAAAARRIEGVTLELLADLAEGNGELPG